eukprot:1026252-Karenia_brevis.AAC.1
MASCIVDDVVLCCDLCNKDFKSKQACNMHKSRVHGWIHPAQFYIQGSQCPVCLLEFTTRGRLLQHVMYKGFRCNCLANLYLRGPVLTHEEVKLAMQDVAKTSRANTKAGYRRTRVCAPATRAEGPLLQVLMPFD